MQPGRPLAVAPHPRAEREQQWWKEETGEFPHAAAAVTTTVITNLSPPTRVLLSVIPLSPSGQKCHEQFGQRGVLSEWGPSSLERPRLFEQRASCSVLASVSILYCTKYYPSDNIVAVSFSEERVADVVLQCFRWMRRPSTAQRPPASINRVDSTLKLLLQC